MQYSVMPGENQINFAPASELEEILQNLRTIITTPKYSVPLNREMGITATWLDSPLPVAQAQLTAEIVFAVQRWEPRARVTRVTYVQDSEQGKLIPKVQVRIVE